MQRAAAFARSVVIRQGPTRIPGSDTQLGRRRHHTPPTVDRRFDCCKYGPQRPVQVRAGVKGSFDVVENFARMDAAATPDGAVSPGVMSLAEFGAALA